MLYVKQRNLQETVRFMYACYCTFVTTQIIRCCEKRIIRVQSKSVFSINCFATFLSRCNKQIFLQTKMGSFPSEEDSEKMLLKIRCFVVDSMISIISAELKLKRVPNRALSLPINQRCFFEQTRYVTETNFPAHNSIPVASSFCRLH